MFNKEADWPIARPDKVRWENQTKDTGEKKGGVRGVTRKQDMLRAGKGRSHVAIQRLIEMG